MHRPWIVLAIAVCSIVAPRAQTARPAFEVTSVRRNPAPVAPSILQVRPGGGFIATYQTLTQLIAYGYATQDFRVVEGPGWIRNDHFDVTAKAAGDIPTEQARLMVQSLLADRFRLVVRQEPREMMLYSMVRARADGPLNPALQPVDTCKGVTPPKLTVNQNHICGPLSQLASIASRFLGAFVVDKTGLTGTFSMVISYSTEGLRPTAFPGAPPPPDPNLPSFRDALREQLGLRLESGRGPVDVIVVDSVQPPTEN